MNKKKIALLTGIILIVLAIILLIVFFGKEKEKRITVGIVLTGSINEHGWNGHHYQGLKKACQELNANLLVKENITELTGECRKAVEELIDEGAELIILGSLNYHSEVTDLIENNPSISFYCCSSSEYADNVSTYFVRIYQARYLAGIVAGMQTENGKIGYVAAMPNSEVNRGINAFTLGVRRANPNAEVDVIWTGSWNDEESERKAARSLINDIGVDLITYHQNQDFVIDEAEKAGIYSIGYHEYMPGYSERYLTAVEESWDNVYSEILKEYMQGKGNSSRLIWLGIEKEAVKLSPYTSLVSDESKALVNTAMERIQNGWVVFSDLIETNDGEIKCHDGEVISDDILFGKMDWFVKGVVVYDK